jgi:hypothetical protein
LKSNRFDSFDWHKSARRSCGATRRAVQTECNAAPAVVLVILNVFSLNLYSVHASSVKDTSGQEQGKFILGE